MIEKTGRIWRFYLGVEVTWLAWGAGLRLDMSPHAWRPYAELQIGPVGFYAAYEARRRHQ